MRTLFLYAALLASGPAFAGCELSLSPCATDRYGNTYTTEENLGGGYTTYRNGSRYSTTEETLTGGWKTTLPDGNQIFTDDDPYAPKVQKRPYGSLIYGD